MFELYGMKFANSIGVLYDLKQLKKHKTMQETYSLLETSDFDTMISILTVAFNKANKTTHDESSFIELLEEKGYGFLVIADLYKEFVEGIMFAGLTQDQVNERKKLIDPNLK